MIWTRKRRTFLTSWFLHPLVPQMIVQALEYERRGRDTDPSGGRFLQSFFDSTRGKFTHPKVKEWVEELERQRDTEFPKTQ